MNCYRQNIYPINTLKVKVQNPLIMSWGQYAIVGGLAYATGFVTGPVIVAVGAGMYLRGRKKKIVVVEKVVYLEDSDSNEDVDNVATNVKLM